MIKASRVLVQAMALSAALIPGPVRAEGNALHGGAVFATQAHQFETLFTEDGIHVYIYTKDQAPMMVESAKGTASLRFPDGSKRDLAMVRGEPAKGDGIVYFCPMHPQVVRKEPGECELCGGMKLYEQDYLFAKADLSGTKPGEMKVLFEISGLGKPEPTARFAESFTGIRAGASKASGVEATGKTPPTDK